MGAVQPAAAGPLRRPDPPPPAAGLRLGRSSAQGFEDAMRDLRFKPLLQLGLAYSY